MVIEACGTAISAVHRGDLKGCDAKLREAETGITRVRELSAKHAYASRLAVIRDALCEYVEASCLRQVVETGKVPSYTEFKVEPDEYLLGLADLVGELRRLCLDLVRGDQLGEAETVFKRMEEVFEFVMSFEYPKQSVKGLRHKVDVDRRLLDDTRLILTQAHIANKGR